MDEDYPMLGQVKELYMIDTTKPMAIVTVMSTLAFNKHYHGYTLSYSTSTRVISLKTLFHSMLEDVQMATDWW